MPVLVPVPCNAYGPLPSNQKSPVYKCKNQDFRSILEKNKISYLGGTRLSPPVEQVSVINYPVNPTHFAWFIFTARKQGLEQGNIFRSVCQSFSPQRRVHGRGCLCGGGWEACIARGCTVVGCMWQGHAWQGVCVLGAYMKERQPLKEAVSILLGFILVKL